MTSTMTTDRSYPLPAPEFIDRSIHLKAMAGLLNLLAPVQHRGLSRLVGILQSVFPVENTVTRVKLGEDAIFSFPTYDDYWGYFLLTGRNYEPEIASFLMRLKNVPFSFLDCGANYGYWSVLVSSTVFGRHPTIAVEASSSTFRLLERNAKLNSENYLCLRRAISGEADNVVRFSRHSHHGSRSIIADICCEHQDYEEVRTETIDSLIATHMHVGSSVICKLDVEGAEISAFEGAAEAFTRDVVFIYEDHGKDSECLPSKYLLDRGIDIFVITASGALRQVKDIEGIRREKINKKRGYNFVALGSGGPLCNLSRSLS